MIRPAFLLALLLPLTAAGFSVNPMSVEIDPNQPNAQKLFVLTNTTDKPIPVEVRVARPELDEKGDETLKLGEGEDAFVILPQQLVIPPGARRSVKVTYVGESTQKEETYRVLFRQLPVALPTDAAAPADADRPSFNMQVVLEYHTRVWITPRGLKEKLEVKSFTKTDAVIAPTESNASATVATATEAKIQPVLQVVIANSGNKHGYLVDPKLAVVTTAGEERPLSAEMVKAMVGQVVLGGRDRTFNLPWQEGLPPVDQIRELRLTVGKL